MYDMDFAPPEDLLPAEREIISELQTNEARWNLMIRFGKGDRPVSMKSLSMYGRNA